VASPEPVDLSARQWQLPLTLTYGELSNQTGAIGMNKQATLTGRDQFDGVSAPMMAGFGLAEIVFAHPEVDMKFCREIVPTAENFVWTFEVARVPGNLVRLTWDHELVQAGDKELFLFDPSTGDMKNMLLENYYIIPKSSDQLRILFGDAQFIGEKKDELMPMFGTPFPNPAVTDVVVPFHIAESLGQVPVSVQVYDGVGRHVATVADGYYEAGDHTAIWQTQGTGAGLFTIHMKAGQDATKRVKIIVK
jgi:hypothetical protein